MKLCPYPFSRMQTKNDQIHTENKGGFFPCCPSWFDQSYWDFGLEKNLEDIWNGKQAQELRKRMYEGDYSFCNRNECKIPLMTVEEMANPDINFIETPISKENLEAIKNKNPEMPNHPSSLHLVADLRCNLKCPTCRPEVISNKEESIEADEEFELVQKLKADVEIIKMSSSGEVFYSQVQRKLLKSYNKDDFPKLRRVHIVSNGTLFNQKAYNDLSPGTTYIKDISISLDAGTKEVYEKLRGPYWEQVVSNLEWMGQMRKAGKFELFTLNFTLIRDNYRDIPQLVELGRRCNVDRILIQKYNFALNQGFKTRQEQVAQAIHLPSHPEHIHMIRTLEMFKNDPLVHTLLDIEGFDNKIEDHVRIRKAIAEMHGVSNKLESGDFLNSLITINELFGASPFQENHLNSMAANFENSIVDLKSIPLIDHQESEVLANIGVKHYLISALLNSIYNCHKKDEHKKVISSFLILHHFMRDYPADIFSIVAASLKGLSRFEEAELFLQEYVEGYVAGIHQGAKNPLEPYLVNMQLGHSFKSQSNFVFAANYFKKALAIEPEEKAGEAGEQLYYVLLDEGFSLMKSNNPEALNLFLEAKDYEPKEKEGAVDEQLYYALLNKGFSLMKENNPEALDVFLKAQQHEPKEKRGAAGEQLYYIYLNQAFAVVNENRNEALRLFTLAQAHEPQKKNEVQKYINDINYYSNRELGFTYQQKGKYSQAANVFLEALKFGQGDADLFFSLGISLKRLKNYSVAKDIFNKALIHNPDHYHAIMELGTIEFLEGKNKEALNYFQKAQKIQPEDKKAYSEKMIRLASRNRNFINLRHQLTNLLK